MGKPVSYCIQVQNSYVTILHNLHVGRPACRLTGSFKSCDKNLVAEYTVETFSVTTDDMNRDTR